MKVSIIVATYNRAKTLSKALESILKQTHSDIEVLVVDDGSTDTTEELMKTVRDFRVRYIKIPANVGASIARNRGIQEATGDYILVWDSDDELYLNALERIISIFEQQPLVSIVSAPARVFVAGKEKAYPHFPTGEVVLADILLKKIPSNEKVRVAKASVMKQVSYVSRNIDFLVNVALIEKGKWFHLQEFLGDIHNDPIQGSLTALRRQRSVQRSIDRAPHLIKFLEKHGEYLKKISSPRYADYCYGTAIGQLLGGDVSSARYYTRQAVYNHMGMISYWGLWILSVTPFGGRLLKLFY